MPTLLDRPHHDGSPLHVPEASPSLGDRVATFVRAPHGAGIDAVHVRMVRDGEPVYAQAVVDRVTADATWWRVEVVVANPITRYRYLLAGPGGYRWLTAAGLQGWDPVDATDFRLVVGSEAPAWAADAVCYQIFPDRFARSGDTPPVPSWAIPARWDDPVLRGGDAAMRQFYGGDLPGIVSRLDHIADLGADTVYLTPVFPAESNHRYDAASFDTVDPLLGGDEALAALSAALHDRGMRLIGDLTLNHSGDTHPWFRTAQADASSLEASFYVFDDHPHDYRMWLDATTLPKFDHRSAELRRRLYEGPDSVAARYLRPPFSLDGWRVDAANMAGRFADVDANAAIRSGLASTVAALGRTAEVALLAEHCHDASRDLETPGWHGTMNYAGFTRPVWSWLGVPGPATERFLGMPVPVPRLPGDAVARTIDAFRAALGWHGALHSLNQLDSHDTARFATVAGGREAALVGAAWLITSPGLPMIFAGDELGLQGFDNEDARRPMPWDGAGWDTEVHATYRELIALRRAHVALRRGGFRWAHIGDDCLVYLREHPEERLLVRLSRAAHPPVVLHADALGAPSATTLNGGEDLAARDGVLALPAEGPSFAVWSLNG